MRKIKGDIIWGAILLIWILILVIPASRNVFIYVTENYPYLGGFIKFFILATMGDLLGSRILHSKWIIPQGLFFKALVWGIIGMMITLLFTVFMTGVASAQEVGKLPFAGVTFANALFGSVLMNATFGPMLYIYHRFGDLFVDMQYEKKQGVISNITVREMVERIDWYNIVSFSWLKTCILVWMPLHTVVFLLPSEYRVIAAAFSSILLGVFANLSKKRAMHSHENK